ncbi:MAG: hypothetical protein LC624_02020, partial [Halobacteriales archaeon]|nr:hypothetical protein [Halobacteriales archaeon]
LKEVAVKGKLVHLNGTATWTAATPVTQQLTILLAHRSGSGWAWDSGDPSAQGASPLKLDFDLTSANTTVALWVLSGTGADAVVAGAYAALAQTFDVQAEVRSLA